MEEALTHKSWSAENEGTGPNEKLEFLGDSVLGLIVTEHIYTNYPELSEGQLSLLRSVVVGRNSLKEVAEEKMETASQEDVEPEETIYSGGFETFNKDIPLFEKFHSSDWKDKLSLLDKLKDYSLN